MKRRTSPSALINPSSPIIIKAMGQASNNNSNNSKDWDQCVVRSWLSEEKFNTDSLFFWHYVKLSLHKRTRRKKQGEVKKEVQFEKLKQLIDKVSPNLIAKLAIRKLFDNAPTFAREAMKYTLPLDHVSCVKSLEERDLDEKVRRITKKGRPQQLVRPHLAKILREMSNITSNNNNSSLFLNDNNKAVNEVRILQKKNVLDCYANMFLVDKSSFNEELQEYLKRIITDCRATNAFLKNPVNMELFTLDVFRQRLVKCIRSLKKSAEGVFALSTDLRHWFHQIPFPWQFHKYVSLNLGEEGGLIFPRCFPMGLHMSPGVAQACTWSLLLAGIEQQESNQLRRELEIDWPEDRPFDKNLTWLPLKSNGGIFVLIDNIFIFTSSKKTAKLWKRRILDMTNKYKATLKHPEGVNVPPAESSCFQENTAEAIEEKILKPDSEDSIDFAGMRVSGRGIQVAPKWIDDEELEDNSATSWTGSYRDLASLLGKCLWYHRVHDRRLLQIEDLMKLFRVAHPKDENEDWHAEITLSGEDFRTLVKHYVICKENKITCWPTHPPNLEDALLLATDASGMKKEGTLEQRRGGLATVMQLSSKLQIDEEGKLKRSPTVIAERHEDEEIAVAELRAVVRAVEQAYEVFGKERIGMVVLAIDSMAAKGMIARGFSTNPRAVELLKRLECLLEQRKIYMMYVESSKNPADEPSRSEELDLEKWNTLLGSLEGMHVEAKEYFAWTGHRIGQRRRIREDVV